LDLSIIIVNWNSREYLKNCIASIFENTREILFEIVVVDSGSFDGCDQMLQQHYPEIRLIQAQENLGFAKANNRAAEVVTGDILLFLNPDTVLVGSAIDTLYRAFQSMSKCGIAGGRLLNADGSVQTSCIQAFPTILNKTLDSEFLRSKWPNSSLWGVAPLNKEGVLPSPVEAISGACLLIRRSTFREVGGFSEEYFMYAEDVDLCHKVRKAGYTNYYVPKANLFHFGGTSSAHADTKFSTVMMPEATWRFLRKTRGRAYACGFRIGLCLTAIGRLVLLGFAVAFKRAEKRPDWVASFRKWFAVLKWSLHRDELVKHYYPGDQVSLLR
jgi:GT2 family glycosyltransferase